MKIKLLLFTSLFFLITLITPIVSVFADNMETVWHTSEVLYVCPTNDFLVVRLDVSVNSTLPLRPENLKELVISYYIDTEGVDYTTDDWLLCRQFVFNHSPRQTVILDGLTYANNTTIEFTTTYLNFYSNCAYYLDSELLYFYEYATPTPSLSPTPSPSPIPSPSPFPTTIPFPTPTDIPFVDVIPTPLPNIADSITPIPSNSDFGQTIDYVKNISGQVLSLSIPIDFGGFVFIFKPFRVLFGLFIFCTLLSVIFRRYD